MIRSTLKPLNPSTLNIPATGSYPFSMSRFKLDRNSNSLHPSTLLEDPYLEFGMQNISLDLTLSFDAILDSLSPTNLISPKNCSSHFDSGFLSPKYDTWDDLSDHSTSVFITDDMKTACLSRYCHSQTSRLNRAVRF